MRTKLDKRVIYLITILASLLLNFTALYIIRLWIYQVYEASKTDGYTAIVRLLDKLSLIPIALWCTISFSAGMVIMFVLTWVLKDVKMERQDYLK